MESILKKNKESSLTKDLFILIIIAPEQMWVNCSSPQMESREAEWPLRHSTLGVGPIWREDSGITKPMLVLGLGYGPHEGTDGGGLTCVTEEALTRRKRSGTNPNKIMCVVALFGKELLWTAKSTQFTSLKFYYFLKHLWDGKWTDAGKRVD